MNSRDNYDISSFVPTPSSSFIDAFEEYVRSESSAKWADSARQTWEDAELSREVLPILLDAVRRPGDTDADARRRLIEGGAR